MSHTNFSDNVFISSSCNSLTSTLFVFIFFNHKVPTTLNEEWADKTVRLSAAKPREGCDRPIPMDPMTNGFPVRYGTTAADLLQDDKQLCAVEVLSER